MTSDTRTPASPALRRIESTQPWRGMRRILGVELKVWFPWRWLVLSAAGFGVFALIYVPWTITETNQLGTLVYFFVGLWLAVMLIATVSLTEGSVLGEIERGTASWLVALPIARPAVIVGKFIAAAAGITAIVFTVGLAVYPVLSAASTRGITDFTYNEVVETASAPIGMWGRYTTVADLGTWVVALAAIVMLLVFVVAVMMLLGTVLRSRVAVFGLGLLVIGVLAGLGFSASTATASPAGLVTAIADTLQGQSPEFGAPLLATGLATAGVLLVTIWGFNRRELT